MLKRLSPSHRPSSRGSVSLALAAAIPLWLLPASSGFPVLVSPNGGEMWTEGEHRTITWDPNGRTGKLRVDLTLDDGRSWLPIGTGRADQRQLTWTIPHLADTPVTTARIRVADVADSTARDVSDAPFTILPLPPASVVVAETERRDGAEEIRLLGTAPNPAVSGTEIRWEQLVESDVILRLHDRDGRTVWESGPEAHAAGRHAITIPADALPTGAYLLELRAGRSFVTGLLVVAH